MVLRAFIIVFIKGSANIYLKNFYNFRGKLHERSARDAAINPINEYSSSYGVGNGAKFWLLVALLPSCSQLAGERRRKPLPNFWRHCVGLHF